MRKETLKKGIEEVTRRLFELAKDRAGFQPMAVSELREKHSLALQLYAQEAGIKMSELRINRFTGSIYTGKDKHVTPEMVEKYRERAPLYISGLLFDEFPVEQPNPGYNGVAYTITKATG
jgi:hypothetical protein